MSKKRCPIPKHIHLYREPSGMVSAVNTRTGRATTVIQYAWDDLREVVPCLKSVIKGHGGWLLCYLPKGSVRIIV